MLWGRVITASLMDEHELQKDFVLEERDACKVKRSYQTLWLEVTQRFDWSPVSAVVSSSTDCFYPSETEVRASSNVCTETSSSKETEACERCTERDSNQILRDWSAREWAGLQRTSCITRRCREKDGRHVLVDTSSHEDTYRDPEGLFQLFGRPVSNVGHIKKLNIFYTTSQRSTTWAVEK